MASPSQSVHLASAPGAAEAKKQPREFSLLSQAAGQGDGKLDSLPKEALQGVVQQYGSDGKEELPAELPFDKLVACLHRGHEIVGIVTEVGSDVNSFKLGDRAAVGCMVGSCGGCAECKHGLEQYCTGKTGVVWTYDSENPREAGAVTKGGYRTHLAVSEKYALHLPASLPMDANKPGTRVGVVGLGGLGHMAVKLAKAFGCEVTVISTSPKKKEEALRTLGADHFLFSKDQEAMQKAGASLDGLIDAVSVPHDLAPYLSLLGTDGKLVMVGLSPEPLPLPPFAVATGEPGRKVVAGSSIGGITETQEMLDFCAEHNITCDIERISIDYVNTAMERLVKNDVHYRFVLDIQGSLVA